MKKVFQKTVARFLSTCLSIALVQKCLHVHLGKAMRAIVKLPEDFRKECLIKINEGLKNIQHQMELDIWEKLMSLTKNARL